MIDVINTPGGMDQLKMLGVRNVPVVAVGDRYTFAQNLKDVAKFLGVTMNRQQLAPGVLVERYLSILSTAQRLVRQIPDDRMDERVIPNRPRVLWPFAYHMFRICDAFLQVYDEKALYTPTIANIDPPEHLKTGRQIADEYGTEIRQRLTVWWAATPDKAMEKKLNTFYGMQAAHDVFERSVWHSAQHCRQLAVVLDRWGIKADGPLTPEQVQGLPMPDGLWE